MLLINKSLRISLRIYLRIPLTNFKDFAGPRFRALEQIDERVKFDKMLQKDFSQQINVVNALGKLGFEMSGNTLAVRNNSHHLRQSFWFKRKK